MIAPGGSGVGFQAAGGPTVVTSSTTTQATASSFYVLAYYASTGAVTSVTDTFSNTYTAVTAEVADVSDGGFIRVYQTQNGAGGAGHVATVHLSPTEIGMAIFVEVTGGSTSSILDTQNAVYGTAGSPFACNVTTANPIDLLLGFIISASASTSESFTSTLLTNSITQFNF